MTNHRRLSPARREQYERLRQMMTQAYSFMVMLDREMKEINPAHARRWLSRDERRELARERDMAGAGRE